MAKRTFYLSSIVLVVVALGLHLVARQQILKGQRLKAANIEFAVKHQTQVVADPTAKRLSDSGRVLNVVGLIFTICSLACLVVALLRRESGWYLIPILLLVFDVIEQMLL